MLLELTTIRQSSEPQGCEQASEPPLPASLQQSFRVPGAAEAAARVDPGWPGKPRPRAASPCARSSGAEWGRVGPSSARDPARLKAGRHFRLKAAFTSFCGAVTQLLSPTPRSRGPT